MPFFKIYSPVEVIYFCLDSISLSFFPLNTSSTDGNGVNKQNALMHTKQSET